MPKTSDTVQDVITIKHDAFGRWSLVRALVNDGTQCSYCGQPARFRYGTEHDDRPGRIQWAKRSFCNVYCYRAYYG